MPTPTARGYPVPNLTGDGSDLHQMFEDALDAVDADVSAVEAAKQPLDSDLTAIAALSTTAFGRALLEVANAAAGRTALAAAPLDSPALTGNPTAPTPSPGDDDTSIATTAFVATPGAWHEIGAGGEPAFTNSWVNFGGGNVTAAFRKAPDGRVQLKGLVKTGTLGLSAFTLPAGYRPPVLLRFAVVSNGAFGYAAVGSDGTVAPTNGSNVSFALDQISFYTD
jgi:hypothetical protein